ncbi:Elongator complex protein 5 [Abeliophyllum distichum]|uniref:Elongator complex protein 5 n=1 Tax=Abeliophyllum distichum TaxID=126358 RepID=A0ABD1V315_9LAMI
MAERICRALRDGVLEGEHAPALTIKDSIQSPFGFLVFNHVLSQLSSFIVAQKSQSQGIVLVALSRGPLYYEELFKSKGNDVSSSNKWIRVLDCCTDPLGWRSKLMESGRIANLTLGTSTTASLYKNAKDLDKLLLAITELGKELVGDGKGRFAVAIDSVSEMLRHTSISSVAGLLSNLRSHDQVSCLFWLLHSDIHETKATAALEYISSMQASAEPRTRPVNGQRGNYEKLPFLEQNLRGGKIHVRFKRRNGRVRLMSEEFCIEQSGIKFTPISSEAEMMARSLVPKVQFNLQLSEKERNDREKVVLPFEHQGNGKTIQIYDGRKSLNEDKPEMQYTSAEKVQTVKDSGRGEIIYFRDSDDEMPDSDEDPDDDLDI